MPAGRRKLVQIKSYLAALVLSVLVAPQAFVQDASSSQQPKEDTKQPAASALEDLLAKALKQNPDILVAQAKVREAEAELNRVRQQVLAKIVILNAEIDAARVFLKEAEYRFARLRELQRKSMVPDEEFGTGQFTVLKYKAELARKEAELSLLIGKKVAGLTDQSKALAISPDGQWMVMEDGSVRVKNLTDKWVDPRTLDLKKPTAEKVRAALETQIKVQFSKVPLEEVLHQLQAMVKGVNLFLTAPQNRPVTAKLEEPVSLLAVLQLLEDVTGLSFIVREYGIVAVERSNLPPGALLVSDFARQPAEKTTK
jgi:hypothetical protein